MRCSQGELIKSPRAIKAVSDAWNMPMNIFGMNKTLAGVKFLDWTYFFMIKQFCRI